MLGVIAITLLYVAFVWLVFFKFKLMRFTPAWGLVSAFFILHLLIVPYIGTRMQSPFTSNNQLVTIPTEHRSHELLAAKE